MSIAAVTALYGCALIFLALAWMWIGFRPSLRRMGAVAGLFFLLPIAVAPFVLMGSSEAPLWLIPIEEAAKLVAIRLLRGRGGLAVATAFLFGAVEVVTSKALFAAFNDVGVGNAVWLAVITGAILVHIATGFIYSAWGKRPTAWLFVITTIGHGINNVGADVIQTQVSTMSAFLAVQYGVVIVLLTAAIWFARAHREREPLAPQRGLV